MNFLSVKQLVLLTIIAGCVQQSSAGPITLATSTNLKELIVQHPRYESTLLNATNLPFLNDCFEPKHKHSVQDLCYGYFEMISAIDEAAISVAPNAVDEAMLIYNNATIVSNFCTRLPLFIPAEGPRFYVKAKKFQEIVRNAEVCNYICMNEDDEGGKNVTINPICKLISYGYWELSKVVPVKSASEAVSVKVDSVVAVANSTVSLGLNSQAAVLEDKVNESTNANSQKNVTLPTVASEKSVKVDEPVQQKVDLAPISEVADAQNVLENGQIDSNQKVANSSINVAASLNPNPSINVAASINPNPPVFKPIETVVEGTKKESPEIIPNSANKTSEVVVPINDKLSEKPVLEPSEAKLDVNVSAPNNTSSVAAVPSAVVDGSLDENSEELEGVPPLDDINDGGQSDFDPDDDEQQLYDNRKPILTDSGADSSTVVRPEQMVADPFLEESNSNFFTYFMFIMFICIIAYVVYHNKTKVLALLLEGRRNGGGSNGSGRNGSTSRRKHTAAYRKLDSNLEEAITSASSNGRRAQIIY